MENEKYTALRGAVYDLGNKIAKLVNTAAAKCVYQAIDDVFMRDLVDNLDEIKGFALNFECSQEFMCTLRDLKSLAHKFYTDEASLMVKNNIIYLTIYVTLKQAELIRENGVNFEDTNK